MKTMLFVYVKNVCRSQMAKGFFNTFTKYAIADSSGLNPAQHIDPLAVKVMQEIKIDIGEYIPKIISVFNMNNEYDYIVKMGCMDNCPVNPKEKTIEWDIIDPKG